MSASDSILYYPTIEFRDEAWLKAALLVWDHVYRIVPRSYIPRDSEGVRAAVAADRVRAVVLEDGDYKDIYSEFDQFLGQLEFKPAGLDAQITARLHSDKIDKRLYPIIRDLATNFSGDWLELPTDIAHGYMMYLATAVAKRRNFERGTDNADAWTTATFFSEDGNVSEFVYTADESDSVRCLGLRDIIPVSIADVPILGIIDFS